MSIPQLIVGPHNSSSLIFSDSIFESAQITLLGVSGIALDIKSGSIQSLGGMELAGNAKILSVNDVSLTGGITAALVVDGGVYIDKHLYVNNNISLAGDLEVGITGELSSSMYIGAQNDINSWKFTRVDGGLYVYKWTGASYQLYMKLEDSVC
jgi:hypothetical protein